LEGAVIPTPIATVSSGFLFYVNLVFQVLGSISI
jgi:hypothetical protein